MRKVAVEALSWVGFVFLTLLPFVIFFALGWFFAVQLAATTPLPV